MGHVPGGPIESNVKGGMEKLRRWDFGDSALALSFELSALVAAISPRSQTDFALERSREMSAFGKTDRECDFCDHEIAILQKLARLANPIAVEVCHRSHPQFLAETIGQVIRANIDVACDLFA